jgi:hypothetical protein
MEEQKEENKDEKKKNSEPKAQPTPKPQGLIDMDSFSKPLDRVRREINSEFDLMNSEEK